MNKTATVRQITPEDRRAALQAGQMHLRSFRAKEIPVFVIIKNTLKDRIGAHNLKASSDVLAAAHQLTAVLVKAPTPAQ